LRQVEEHLAGCPTCRAEWVELQNLSALLQNTSPEGEFLSTERFVANLTLNLPRQPAQSQPRQALKLGWWLIPPGLLGTWLFIQITSSLSLVGKVVADSGLLGGNLGLAQANPLQTQWFAILMNLFGSQIVGPLQGPLAVLNDADVFIAQLARGLLPQAILAVAYVGWLFVWWLRRQPKPSQSAERFSRS
jgi:hypothetical protein